MYILFYTLRQLFVLKFFILLYCNLRWRLAVSTARLPQSGSHIELAQSWIYLSNYPQSHEKQCFIYEELSLILFLAFFGTFWDAILAVHIRLSINTYSTSTTYMCICMCRSCTHAQLENDSQHERGRRKRATYFCWLLNYFEFRSELWVSSQMYIYYTRISILYVCACISPSKSSGCTATIKSVRASSSRCHENENLWNIIRTSLGTFWVHPQTIVWLLDSSKIALA